MERALLLATGDSITPEDLPLEKMRGAPVTAPLPVVTAPPIRGDDYQRIVDSLAQCSGNQTRAARLLGMSRRTFCARLKAYNIPRPRT